MAISVGTKQRQGIAKWPKLERPRERLLTQGGESVSDAGLIAILLRIGSKGEDAVALARRLLKQFGGLNGLLYASAKELYDIKGLGPAKIAVLMAVKEIAKRCVSEKLQGKDYIQSASDVLDILASTLRGAKKEFFKVIFLDRSNHILSIEDLFEGTVDQSAVYPREVIQRALEIGSTGLVFVHNHPSGNMEPSPHDIELTKKLFEACRAVDLRPLDHLIISNDKIIREIGGHELNSSN